MPSDKKNTDQWLTKKQVCGCFGISTRHFDSSIRPKLPADAYRKGGRQLMVHGPSVYQLLLAKPTREAKPVSKPSPIDEEKLLKATVDRKRAEFEFDQAKRLAQKEDGMLLPIEEVQYVMRLVGTRYRKCHDLLIRRNGETTKEAITEAQRDIDELLARLKVKRL